jgi:hypothetical protein
MAKNSGKFQFSTFTLLIYQENVTMFFVATPSRFLGLFWHNPNEINGFDSPTRL